MLIHRTSLLVFAASAAAPCFVASSAGAEIVYTEDFEGDAIPFGYSGSGHYSGSALDTNSGNGTNVLYLETDHATSIFFNSDNSGSPIVIGEGDTIEFEFDLLGPSSNDPANLDDTPLRVSFFIAGNTTAFATQDFTQEGVESVFAAVSGGAGSLAIGFSNVGTSDYNQIELDNFSVDITAVPEPASLALLGLGGLLLTTRRR